MSKPGRLLERDDCLLVVIDVQEKLLPVICEKDKVAEHVAKLVQFARIARLPVLFTEQMKLGPTISAVASLAPEFKAVQKITFDCFGCQEFREAVAKLGRKTLVLTGIEAHICVAQTALSALTNYSVQVVSDAISSRSLHNWVVAMERMRQAGCVMTSTEMFIYEVLGQAGTDEFKATLPLVK